MQKSILINEINNFLKEFKSSNAKVCYYKNNKVDIADMLLRPIDEVYVYVALYLNTKGIVASYDEVIEVLKMSKVYAPVGGVDAAIYNLNFKKFIEYLTDCKFNENVEGRMSAMASNIKSLETMMTLKLGDHFNQSNDRVITAVNTIMDEKLTKIKNDAESMINDVKASNNNNANNIGVSLVSTIQSIRDIVGTLKDPIAAEFSVPADIDQIVSDDTITMLELFKKDGCDILINDKDCKFWRVMKNRKTYAILPYDKLRINQDTFTL